MQFVVFNVLRYAGPVGQGLLVAKPITAQVIAIGAATVITYLGNRYWTYQHRAKGTRSASCRSSCCSTGSRSPSARPAWPCRTTSWA